MSEMCMDCGLSYDTVYCIPDEIWKLITGRANSSGLLCPICADKKARAIDIILYWEAGIGKYPRKEPEMKNPRCNKHGEEKEKTWWGGWICPKCDEEEDERYLTSD